MAQVAKVSHANNTGVYLFEIQNSIASLAYPDSAGNMFIVPAATWFSTNPETFAYTATVTVGASGEVIDKHQFYVGPGVLVASASLVFVTRAAQYRAGELTTGTRSFLAWRRA